MGEDGGGRCRGGGHGELLRAFQSVALVQSLDMAEFDSTLRFNAALPTTIVNIILRLLASSEIIVVSDVNPPIGVVL